MLDFFQLSIILVSSLFCGFLAFRLGNSLYLP